MKNKLFIKSSVALLGMVLITGSPAFADKGRDHTKSGEKFKGRMLERMSKDLNLSPEQIAKIKSIDEANAESEKQAREKVKVAMDALDKSMESGASETELLSQFESVQKARQDAGKIHFQKMLKTREVLNPEQRKKFREKMEKHKGKFKERFEKMHKDGPEEGGMPPF